MCMYDNIYEGTGGCYIRNRNADTATVPRGMFCQSVLLGMVVLNTAYDA
jgi:hypothetical protein